MAPSMNATQLLDDAMDIPIIDLSRLPEDQDGVVRQIGQAARGPGFFYVIGHGVPPEVIEDQFEVSRQFFELAPHEKAEVSIHQSRAMRGYETLGSQTLDASAMADLKESFQCGIEYPLDHPYVAKGYPSYGPNQWPKRLPELQAHSERYVDALRGLAARLMALLAQSLGLPSDYFAALDHAPAVTLRMLRYPPQPGNADGRTFGAGAHTDWGAITVLAQDGHGGLEVCLPDGRWVAAPPVANSLVVNLGDMIPRWTHGRYRSNPHRVRNLYSHGKHRFSIAFFADLDYEARITPIASCLDPGAAMADADTEPITVGQHMKEMYARTYGGTGA